MITTHEKIGVGYFDTVFANIEIETMIKILEELDVIQYSVILSKKK